MPDTSLISKRLRYMAREMAKSKAGPQARFFTQDRIDELVVLLREADAALTGLRWVLRQDECAVRERVWTLLSRGELKLTSDRELVVAESRDGQA
jgi:hypothetical protein